MSIEDRLSALETRLRAAEDQLEIIRLLNTYGPAVDSGASRPAAQLWIEGGTYNIGGVGPVTGHDKIAATFWLKLAHVISSEEEFEEVVLYKVVYDSKTF